MKLLHNIDLGYGISDAKVIKYFSFFFSATKIASANYCKFLVVVTFYLLYFY